MISYIFNRFTNYISSNYCGKHGEYIIFTHITELTWTSAQLLQNNSLPCITISKASYTYVVIYNSRLYLMGYFYLVLHKHIRRRSDCPELLI